jgi:hypothetical protein
LQAVSSIAGSSTTRSRGIDWGRYALVALATIVAAVAANVVVHALGSVLVGYDPRFLPLAGPGGAIIFTVVPAVVAALLYALLLRFAANPARVFAIVAAVVFVLTLIPDFTYIPTVPGATAGQTVVLIVMHAVAALVIVGMLTTLARPRPR